MTSEKNINPLINYLNSIVELPVDFVQDLQDEVLQVFVKRGKFILSPLDKNEYLFFIVSGGVVRGFIKDKNKEITTWLSCGNELIGATKHPDPKEKTSNEYLQAITDCTLLALPLLFIERLYSKYTIANILGRKILKIQYYKSVEKSNLARIPSAERRYSHFEKDCPECINKIPLRCISSYLVMRVETLSRIRAKRFYI